MSEAMTLITINRKVVALVGENSDKVAGSPKFLAWASKISPEFNFNNIFIRKTFFLPNGDLLFALLDCQVTRDGNRVPGVIFMRGDAVGILLDIDVEGVSYTILTRQYRLATGGVMAEIPAGMLDTQTGNFSGVALKELQEEVFGETYQLDINNLIPLGTVYTSPGISDEQIGLFVYPMSMTYQQLMALQAKQTGVLAEGESITLQVIPMAEFHKHISPDAKSYLAHLLWK